MISVCMATYNGAKYIKEQLDSILCQLGDVDELIVSDDGSTDSTIEILRAYNDHRIKIHPNTNRKGVVGNFENALSKASGDYIFLSDQDDVWLEGKVERCVNELQNADLVMHDAAVWDGYNTLHKSFYKLRGTKKGYWQNLYCNSFLGCCLAMRRKMLEYVLPIPNIAMHDIWIGLIITRKGRVSTMDDNLLKYRRHGGNASPTAEKSNLPFGVKIIYRLRFLYYTLTR